MQYSAVAGQLLSSESGEEWRSHILLQHINEAGICIPALHGWAHCSIVLAHTVSGWVIISHEGTLIASAQRGGCDSQPFIFKAVCWTFRLQRFTLSNSIRVCEHSICQNCLQCNWAPYLCPWDSEGASPPSPHACQFASAHSPALPILRQHTDSCLWTLSVD